MTGSGKDAADRPIYGSVLGLSRVGYHPGNEEKPEDTEHIGIQAAAGMNAAMSAGILLHSLRSGDFDAAKTGLVRLFTQAAWIARVSDRFPFLKLIDKDKFFFGLSSASMAVRAPQIYSVALTGTTLPRTLALLVSTAFILQATPVIERIKHRTEKNFVSYFEKNNVAKNIVTHGPNVCLAFNALGSIGHGYLQRNWYTVATSATYLAGIGLMYAAERYFMPRGPQTDPASAHTQIETHAIDPAAGMAHTHS